MDVLKTRKPVLLTVVFAMLLSLFGPIASFASETSKESLISKASEFVYLDAESEKFKVKKEAKDVLTKDELKDVKDIIKNTNSEVTTYRSDLEISGDKFIAKSDSTNSEDIQMSLINKKKNFDYDFTWWGLQVYWSHKFVEKLKDNIVLYGSAVAGLNATIAYYASPPGWVTSFVTAAAGVGVWAFMKQDKGCGVYLDCYLYVPTRWYSAC